MEASRNSSDGGSRLDNEVTQAERTDGSKVREEAEEAGQEVKEAASEAADWMEDAVVSTRERLRKRWGEARTELQGLRDDLQDEKGESRTKIRQRIDELEEETKEIGTRLANLGEDLGEDVRNLIGRDDDSPTARKNYGTPAPPTPAATPEGEAALMPTVTAPMPSPTLPDVPMSPIQPTATPIPTPAPEPTPLPELTPASPTAAPPEELPPDNSEEQL